MKGRNLYGLNHTRDDIRSRGFAVLVEGYFDMLSLWAAGIRNTVASLGTALTRDHLGLLRRYTEELVVIFDPDEAGKSAVERALNIILSEKINARIVILPEDLDPDNYVARYGAEAMEELIEKSQSLVDYYIDNIIGQGKRAEEKMSSLRNSYAFLTEIEDVLQRNLFIKRISERLGIDQEILKKEINKAPVGVKSQDSFASPEVADSIEFSIIRMIMEKQQWRRRLRRGTFFVFM